MKKNLLRILVAIALPIALFVCYRAFFCPKLVVASGIELPQETIDTLRTRLHGDVLDNVKLGAQIKDKKIVLIGETHFRAEVMNYLTDLLGKLPGPHIILHLELPMSVQGMLDAYMETGDQKYLLAVKNCSDCLPYHSIVKWCYDHKGKIERVVAIDENPSRVFLMRCICDDTRNKTMADNILRSRRKYPGRRIVFYGGQLHCLLAGRYLYDHPSRTPVGQLLLQGGNRRSDITTILLDYDNHFPTSAPWDGAIGAARMNSELGVLPPHFFIQDTIFGVKQAKEVFDYYVNVGTSIDQK